MNIDLFLLPKRRLQPCLIWAFLASLTVLFGSIANADELTTAYSFTPLNGVQAGSVASKHSLAGQVWSINLNHALDDVNVGAKIALPMPAGAAISVEVLSRQLMANGDTQLLGKFAEDGLFSITIGDEVAFGSITSRKVHYSISIAGRDEHGVVQAVLIDNKSIPASSIRAQQDFRIPKDIGSRRSHISAAKMLALETAAAKSSALTDIDLLVVYAPEFKTIFVEPETRINQLLAFTNAAFMRSGILINLRLAAAVEVGFDNAANVGANLDAATAGTGAFNQLPQLRNQVGADLVSVLHASPGSSASGVAWISGDSAAIAYSSVRISPGCCDAVFTHELGHNLGSGHEHQAVNPNQGSPCSFSFRDYACGHGNSAQGWGTIMSYLNDRAVGYRFSNLDTDCQGQPCGVPAGQANAADNRRAFNISRLLVSEFRQRPPTNPGTPQVDWLPPIYELLL